MSGVYSLALSTSQGVKSPVVGAHLGYAEDNQRTEVHMEWDLPNAINADGNAEDWLYAVLQQLVQHYEEYRVMRVTVTTDNPEGDRKDG